MTVSDADIDTSHREHISQWFAFVSDEGATALLSVFPSPSARRDGVIEAVAANHDEVSDSEIEEVLSSYSDDEADRALIEVIDLFVQQGNDITVTLEELLIDVGPKKVYSVITEYEPGVTVAEHYDTKQQRLTELRERAANIAPIVDYAPDHFDTADEQECLAVLTTMLTPAPESPSYDRDTGGRVLLTEAVRLEDGSYASEAM